MAVVTLLVLAGLSTMLGAHSSTVSARAGGYRISLTYPSLTRPGLAIRWILTIEHPGGFDGQVTVATTTRYFDLFDFNNLDPVPSGQQTDGTNSIWMFDPPPGDVLQVTMDGRVEPAQQWGKPATTALLVHDVPVVRVTYTTRVLP
jgi:hypothetical protein